MKIDIKDIEDIKYAKSLLESENFAIKTTSIIGKPIESGLNILPNGVNDLILNATTKALEVSLKTAVTTLSKKQSIFSSDNIHKLACATVGGTGGFFGLSALAVELPFSTTIMLRSIADIAHSEGANINTTETALECMSVFAFGGPLIENDTMDSGYYATRIALAETIKNATKYITKEGLKKEAAPIVVKLITEISSKFGIQVSQKITAQAIPVVGAVSGALLNTIFIDHFQDKARGHFIIKRLEKKYSIDLVKEEYSKCLV